jgi:hypothetical protein
LSAELEAMSDNSAVSSLASSSSSPRQRRELLI